MEIKCFRCGQDRYSVNGEKVWYQPIKRNGKPDSDTIYICEKCEALYGRKID